MVADSETKGLPSYGRLHVEICGVAVRWEQRDYGLRREKHHADV